MKNFLSKLTSRKLLLVLTVLVIYLINPTINLKGVFGLVGLYVIAQSVVDTWGKKNTPEIK